MNCSSSISKILMVLPVGFSEKLKLKVQTELAIVEARSRGIDELGLERALVLSSFVSMEVI